MIFAQIQVFVVRLSGQWFVNKNLNMKKCKIEYTVNNCNNSFERGVFDSFYSDYEGEDECTDVIE